MPASVTIEFDVTVTIDGKEYNNITLREPLVKDSIEAADATNSPAAQEAYLIGILSGQGAAFIGKLPIKQYQKIINEFSVFFPRSR
jgi:hypothetical protein